MLSLTSYLVVAALIGADSGAVAELKQLFALAEGYGIQDWLRFDASVVRGLAYYTGTVFEVRFCRLEFFNRMESFLDLATTNGNFGSPYGRFYETKTHKFSVRARIQYDLVPLFDFGPFFGNTLCCWLRCRVLIRTGNCELYVEVVVMTGYSPPMGVTIHLLVDLVLEMLLLLRSVSTPRF